MNKTITLITGAVVTIGLAVFLILGKIDLSTFTMLTSTILGIVYGFYKKIENKELTEEVSYLKDNQDSYNYTIESLIEGNNKLVEVTDRLQRELNYNEVRPEVTELIKEKVTRKAKPKKQ